MFVFKQLKNTLTLWLIRPQSLLPASCSRWEIHNYNGFVPHAHVTCCLKIFPQVLKQCYRQYFVIFPSHTLSISFTLLHPPLSLAQQAIIVFIHTPNGVCHPVTKTETTPIIMSCYISAILTIILSTMIYMYVYMYRGVQTHV